MNKTIGVNGYISTGSSAFVDLLREFDDAQVFDSTEFGYTYFPDGLEDLEYHVRNYHKYMSSVVAIDRFRKYMKLRSRKFDCISTKKINDITNDFLNKIIQVTWIGYGDGIDKLVRSAKELFIKRCIFKAATVLRLNKIFKLYINFLPYKMELSIMPEKFDTASKDFISNILNVMGRSQQQVTVLDQPFEACNPVKSFKFFENPKAIIVVRDPRDHYLFVKCFQQPRGAGYQIPCNNVNDYIKYFRLMHQSLPDLKERGDIMVFNFEELIYDYEETVKRVEDFVRVAQHIRKGECFKPTHSRNNTQLFKKYTGFESDIKKIEQELSEYLFNFESYPDIKSEDRMFFGSQSRKRQ